MFVGWDLYDLALKHILALGGSVRSGYFIPGICLPLGIRRICMRDLYDLDILYLVYVCPSVLLGSG